MILTPRRRQAGFDGAYTYFAADGFTYGATAANWPRMAAFCRRHGLLFVPSVGPGCAFLRAPRAPSATARARGSRIGFGFWFQFQVRGPELHPK